MSQAYQLAGLILYLGDGDYVKLDGVADPGATTRVELRSEVGDAPQQPQQPQQD